VADPDDGDEHLQVSPEGQVNGVQQKEEAKDDQGRTGDEGHEAVTLEGLLH
jgi:hypothetical protein